LTKKPSFENMHLLERSCQMREEQINDWPDYKGNKKTINTQVVKNESN